jgi:hypothetical protein
MTPEQDDGTPQSAPPEPQVPVEAPPDFRHLEEGRKGIMVMPVEPAADFNIVDQVGGLPAPEATAAPVDAPAQDVAPAPLAGPAE